MKLVVLCARTRVEHEEAEGIRALVREGLDWGKVYRLGRRHKLIPLVYRNLRGLCSDAVPEAAIDVLREHYLANSARNLRLAYELVRILGLLKERGIQALPLRGPTLAVCAYGNLALRESIDLDILVRQAEVLEAKELLLSEGYQPEYRLSASEERQYLRDECEYNFHRQDGRVTIEVHWRALPRFFSLEMDRGGVWQRLQRATLVGHEILVQSPEDTLLDLCAHGLKHLWGGLALVCDVGELLHRGEGIDWQGTMDGARKNGFQRMLFLGVCLAGDLLRAPLPAGVLGETRADPDVAWLAEGVRGILLEEDLSALGVVRRHLFRMRARERVGDRLRYAYRLAVTPTVYDRELIRLPEGISFLYCLLRPVRLLVTHAGAWAAPVRNVAQLLGRTVRGLPKVMNGRRGERPSR